MPARIPDVQADHVVRQHQWANIDPGNILQQIKLVHANLAACKATTAHSIDPNEIDLRQELSQVEDLLSSEFLRQRDRTRQKEPLCSLLRATSALPAATEDLGVLQTHERSAAWSVRTCQETVVTLRAVIADARAGHAMAIERASKRVLAAARAGEPAPRTMADRSQLDACESALAMVQAELGQAIAGHQAAESDLAAGQRRLAGANVAAASLVVAMKLRNFAELRI